MSVGLKHTSEDVDKASRWPHVRSALSAAALVALCVVLWRAAVSRALRQEAVELPVALDARLLGLLHVTGSTDARVGLLVFSDFECPACATLARNVLPTVVERYVATGRVFLAFGDLPLETIHPAALRRAMIAECAARQGRFWSVHDRLFAGQTAPSVERDALEGLDRSAVAACLASGSSEAVRARRVVAEALRVSSTPSVFVGRLEGSGLVVTEAIAGAQGVRRLSAALDRHLMR